MIFEAEIVTLTQVEMKQRTKRHQERVQRLIGATKKRRDCGIPHPVTDFLFEYYPYPYALLEKWQPGIGIALPLEEETESIAAGLLDLKFYQVVDLHVQLSVSLISDKEATRLQWIRELLISTRGRPANFSCYGLHEWAMVFGGANVRHHGVALLRLSQNEIDNFVRSRAICCSHHDAFRFFAEGSKSLNRLQPTLGTRTLMEQPGCVHANMDLYKWAAKSMPWIGSELLIDAFEMATWFRELDMRASPYDLSEWDLNPIRIESAEGRIEYESEQRRLAEIASPIRDQLIFQLDLLLGGPEFC